MNRRQLLTKSVASLFLVLLITFAWVIFKGTVLTSNVPKQSGPSTHALFKSLQAGQTELRRYQVFSLLGKSRVNCLAVFLG